MDIEIKNEFLNKYLAYTEDTEPPKIFHIWCALSGVAASLGRRCYFPFGHMKIYPNMYVLLVGPPGARKSTAVSLASRRVRASTPVRFAPKDTGGQRQGLIMAMKNEKEELPVSEAEVDAAVAAASLDMLGELDMGIVQDTRDEHSMYVCADEFTSFIGHGAHDLITFLGTMWDGEDYDYRIKASQEILTDPLLSIIGGTTPTNIATSLPAEAIGQGFTSRIILVYANEKYKMVPRPKPLDPDMEQGVDEVYAWCGESGCIEGAFSETPEASELLDRTYMLEVKLSDPRFIYYVERRHTHLIKLAMSLAAARMTKIIDVCDIEDALNIIEFTEKHMPDALGEFGLSPLATAKQKLVEFMRATKSPVAQNVLWIYMSKDMKQLDFQQCLSELTNAKKLTCHMPREGETTYMYNSNSREDVEKMLRLI